MLCPGGARFIVAVLCSVITSIAPVGRCARPGRGAMAEPRVLPGPAVLRIASCLLDGTDSQTALLSLVALAGVDRSTRSFIACLPATNLQFDSLASCNRKTLGRRPLDREIAFARASPAHKHDFFLAAARLFRGYSEVAFVGPIVTDVVVLEVARQLQLDLRSVRLQGCPAVTDSSINTLLLLCPCLEALHINSLPALQGLFIPAALRQCPQLATLQLAHLPHMLWAALPSAMFHLAKRMQNLRLANVQLTPAYAHLLFANMPNLRWLSLDGSAETVRAAVLHCKKLKELHYAPGPGEMLDDALLALNGARSLKVLQLHPCGSSMSPEQLRSAGQLNLRELRLESQAFRKASVSRDSPSHLDDRGVRALVDSVCQRWTPLQAKPFQLSLCGATSLTHESVSALLRLPVLTDLRIDGCPKIQALDKMRLIAKVKAGRELIEAEARRREASGSLRRQASLDL